MKKCIQKIQSYRPAGFTLLEVVFVIAIFAVMSSIVLFRFNDFGSRTEFDNLTQDIALRIVEAQKAALAGRINPNFDGTIAPSYGVYFNDSLIENKQFEFFNDLTPSGGVADGFYNASTGPCSGVATVGVECISSTQITTGDYISNICYTYNPAGTVITECGNPSIGAPRDLHVVFTRPFPKAVMHITYGVSMTTAYPVQTAYIGLTSGFDASVNKTIVVTSLGEVHVADGTACSVSGATSGC